MIKLCMLVRFQVFVNDQFLNWDPVNRIKVRIVSARAYHSLFMHNMLVNAIPYQLLITCSSYFSVLIIFFERNKIVA